MQTNPHIEQTLAVGIILLFVGTCIIPSTAQDTNKPSLPTLNSFFGLHSKINVSWDANQTSEPLVIDYTRSIPINVTYNCIKGTFGQLILFYYFLTGQSINISLEVEDVPSWCTAYLSNSWLRFPITDTSTTRLTFLVITVDFSAPAFEPFPVKIKASINDMFGPFGFLTLIQGCEVSGNPIFEAGYRPCIVVTPENTSLETSPGTTVIDPITVTNLGNGITRIKVDLTEVPQNWIVSIDPPQMELIVNDSGIMNLSITPPIDFYGNETINLSFTPELYPFRPGCEGPPTNVTISVNVKP
jgi:hypothetical protein